jgi:HSP20 family protein
MEFVPKPIGTGLEREEMSITIINIKKVELNMTLVKVPNVIRKRPVGGFFDNFFGDDFFSPIFQERLFSGTVPSVNVAESADGYRIDVAAPGLEKADFKIAVEKDILTIKVEKTNSEEQVEDKYLRREYNFAKFERSFQLPKTVNQEKIDAKYDNGVLHVSLPKREEALEKPSREITIQ